MFSRHVFIVLALLSACGGRLLDTSGDAGPTSGLSDDAGAPASQRDASGLLLVDAGEYVATDASFDARAPFDAARADAAVDAPDAATTCASCGDGSCIDLTTSNANCGACGVVCDGTCTDGRCLVVLASSDNPVSLALDAHNVYFTSYDGSVDRVSIDGGLVTKLVKGLNGPWGIAVDALSVYFTVPNLALSGPLPTFIGAVPVSGGASRTLAANIVGGRAVAIVGGNLYWDSGGYENSTAAEISYVPLGGGTPSTLVSLSGGGIYEIRAIVPWGDLLYFSEDGVGLLTVPVTGGPPHLIASLPPGPTGPLAVDATSVYFISDGSILAMPHAGSPIVTLATTTSGSPTAIAVDGSDVYWTNEYGIDQSTVLRVPLAGGAVTTLASGQGDATAIALDAKNVYWVCSTGDGSVRKLTK